MAMPCLAVPRVCGAVSFVSAALSGRDVVCYKLSSCVSALQILRAEMCERF